MYVHMRFEESPTKSVVVYLVTVGGAVGINLLHHIKLHFYLTEVVDFSAAAGIPTQSSSPQHSDKK